MAKKAQVESREITAEILKEEKREVDRLIYVGPNITELLLVFGKTYEKVPVIPEEFKDLNLKRFFVKISEYPKRKTELAKDAEKVLRQYRTILKEKSKGGNK
ncbi:hypothetical protein FHQ18_11640 [Deferribacter autotrophicus]|uniref:Uncharacterized protein n=1 Tax=Deferribacter autotrophicus TaxID=500465 RepID=A0A5A8EZV0_9BACT|nr:hypothetical protein [Deferribacter autotrophicus]KAA0257210.1 hypothetical protein FHQ18_11640 [Deferribacter autotrophicus]